MPWRAETGVQKVPRVSGLRLMKAQVVKIETQASPSLRQATEWQTRMLTLEPLERTSRALRYWLPRWAWLPVVLERLQMVVVATTRQQELNPR